MAVAVQLARLLPGGARLCVVERHACVGRGLAYGTESLQHRLNVPAARLGLDPLAESEFAEWLRASGRPHLDAAFVPRRWMGDYLAWSFERAVDRAARRGVHLQVMHDVAVGLTPDPAGPRLHLARQGTLHAREVVLATGHLPPGRPGLVGCDWQHPRLRSDPWKAQALRGIATDDEVLVLGSGLSAVDLLLALRERGHRGRVTLLSRRGLLPQAHRRLEARPPERMDPLPLPRAEAGLRPLLRAVRNWMRQVEATGGDWRDVMAALRPVTPERWQHLTLRDRRQFLRHLQPWWDSHRHRMAPDLAERLQAEIEGGRLEVHAGRVTQVLSRPGGQVWVTWRARGGAAVRVQREVAAVVNCTGATTGLRSTTDPLLAGLRDMGVLTSDPLDLGLRVDGQYRPLGRDGQPARQLRYVGPQLKAQWWEAIAIPELRVHARAVARAVAAELAGLPASADHTAP